MLLRCPHATLALLKNSLHSFQRHRCSRMAASLSYTTLLALVPLLTVMFATFSLLPAFTPLKTRLKDSLFQQLMPGFGNQVQHYLDQFGQQAASLNALGTSVLLITALLLMQHIDHAFNDIWGLKNRRSQLRSFLSYWAILSLGPLLLGLGLAFSSYLASLSFLPGNSWPPVHQLWSIFPWLTTLGFLTLLYKLTPCTPIKLSHALCGGAVGSLVFELLKAGFAWYLIHFPSYNAIYGAFAAIPVLLLWIYLSWLVVLFGAEWVLAMGHGRPSKQLPAAGKPLCCQLLLLLHQGFEQHTHCRLDQLAENSQHTAQDCLIQLETLQDLGWVHSDEQNDWHLSTSLHRMDLHQLENIT